jgi:protein ECT2
MYNDANLPEDEAWIALSKDLRQTKEARNNLTKANSYVVDSLDELFANNNRIVI